MRFFVFGRTPKRKRARPHSLRAPQTDRRPGLEFLLRFESTIYEEREAFENTNTPCIIACLCKRSARCFVFVRRREDSVVIGDDDDAGGRCAPSHKRRIVTESTRARTHALRTALSRRFSRHRDSRYDDSRKPYYASGRDHPFTPSFDF